MVTTSITIDVSRPRNTVDACVVCREYVVCGRLEELPPGPQMYVNCYSPGVWLSLWCVCVLTLRTFKVCFVSNLVSQLGTQSWSTDYGKVTQVMRDICVVLSKSWNLGDDR